LSEVSTVQVKVAVIADTHFAPDPLNPERRGEIADILLLRAVRRLNRFVRPDVTLVLGDMVDDGAAEDAASLLRRLRKIVDGVESPTIVIPGNHDGDVDAFYRVFAKPPDFVDVNGVRFVPFIDPEEPQYNARRTEQNLALMAKARAGFDGPIVAVQHVPVFPPGATECPYNYTNAAEVLDAMREHRYGLAVSGHFHAGMGPIEVGQSASVAAPALCRAPFAFITAVISDDGVQVSRHELQMPPELGLFDAHVHTQFAYCSENMDMARALGLAEDFGLAGIAFAEHSGQFDFEEEAYWAGDWYQRGAEKLHRPSGRLDAYVAAARQAGCPAGLIGIEADCNANGRALLRPEDRSKVGFLMGAVHVLPELRAARPNAERAADEYLASLQSLVRDGISVLAHPFRAFRQAGISPPHRLLEHTARLLRGSGVAAEINLHNNEPPPEFIRLCIQSGVKLALGSDAHNLCEIGDFYGNLELLRESGCDADLEVILLNPQDLRKAGAGGKTDPDSHVR
jgi:histidinol phosphatase-like PHP family hydrolase/predicted phosphodiesterase